MEIRTVLFDFGGVLFKMPDSKSIHKWMRFLGIKNSPEIFAMLENPHESELVKDICLGKITEEEAWRMIGTKWLIKPGFIQRIRRNFLSKRSLNRQMVEFMASLKGSYRLGILSNAGDQSRSLMTDVLGLDRFVDEIIISAEEGVIKPDPEIYSIALDRMDTQPEKTLFIDDYYENVQTAQQIGMKAVHFKDNQQTMRRILEIIQEEE
jgi:putative hydrolase of the HAD superfamily